MKKIISTLTLIVLLVGLGVADVFAAPPAPKPPRPDHPNVIVFHNGGSHQIPIAPEARTQENWYLVLEGSDLIMKAGNSDNFHQWFINGKVGYHSVWNVTKNGKCPPHGEIIKGGWGDYMDSSAEYCVITNQFRGIYPPTWK